MSQLCHGCRFTLEQRCVKVAVVFERTAAMVYFRIDDENHLIFMDPNLFKYIWKHSKREQLSILLLVLVSLPFYFLSLSLPKDIVNKGIQGSGFDAPGATQKFLHFDLPYGQALTGAPVTIFGGFELTQPGLLLALSAAFLLLVFINGGFKFKINTLKGSLGERMLRRLRYELTDRLLRFPIPQLRKVKQAEMATMIKDEVEPLGGFIGDAFVSPAFLGGQALTAMAYILVQSLWLGLAAAAIVSVQAFLIPRLRVPILQLGRERQLTARRLAGRVAEVIEGSIEVHTHDTSNFERAEFSRRLGRIYDIRFEIFRRKFFVKFLNNFLAQLTPFIFYSAGGLLAIQGHLDIGALVAVIAAYKDLPGPVKELIDWDQARNDVQIKYDQVIEQFQTQKILAPALQDPDNEPGPPLAGNIAATSLSLVDDGNRRLLDSVTFAAKITDHIAIVGASGSGKEQLGVLLAGLEEPSVGSITFGGRELEHMSETARGRRVSYVGQDCYLFPLSVRDNLLYGLKHKPLVEAKRNGAADAAWKLEQVNAARAGNSTFDLAADWIDYEAAGATGPDDITEKLIAVLSTVDLEPAVYRFGLAGTIDAKDAPQVAESILKARAALLERLTADNAEDLVVRFDPARYNLNATLAENLLFGTPTDESYETEALAGNPTMLAVLDEIGLTGTVLEMGLAIARTMVEIFADLPPGHPFFEQFSFIDADDLPNYRALVSRAEKSGVGVLEAEERRLLLGLPFKYIEARHRLGLIDVDVEEKVVSARARLAERLAAEGIRAVEFYQPDSYNSAASLQDNILFGRLAHGQAEAEETVGRAMTETLDSLGLRQTVIEVGLDFQVGIGGVRLSTVQRQKLGLARALLKQPDLLIINEATAVMDGPTQARLLDRILEKRKGQGVVWALQRPGWAERFDQILVMRDGRMVEQGTFSKLKEMPGSVLNDLLTTE